MQAYSVRVYGVLALYVVCVLLYGMFNICTVSNGRLHTLYSSTSTWYFIMEYGVPGIRSTCTTVLYYNELAHRTLPVLSINTVLEWT